MTLCTRLARDLFIPASSNPSDGFGFRLSCNKVKYCGMKFFQALRGSFFADFSLVVFFVGFVDSFLGI